jgi:23S rRNA (adenine2503-C2)-methyltransferase
MIKPVETLRIAKAGGAFDFTRESLIEQLEAWNEPPYRAEQILRWIYREHATAWEQMSNLSKGLRERLSAEVPIFQSQVVQKQESTDGTVKLLLRWPDGATSECVLIPEAPRNTACISTQVGCPVGCLFCASGLEGLQRNLSAGQIVEQAMRVRELVGGDERLSNIVFMGLGEPLANYEATVQAIRTINADWGMNIGARKITVSTVGLPKQMKRLADENLQITLALSLHAPNDELRRKLIPWAERISMEALIEAGRYYFDQTGREVTLEYILLGGVNDLLEHALELAKVSRKMRSNINLIPYNPVAGLPYERPTKERVHQFVLKLRERGINAHVRKSRGLDIDSACGQLRRRETRRDPKST